MIKLLLLIFAVRPAWSSPKDVRLFFPQDKQYVYEVHASLTTGTGAGPNESSTWTIMGRLKGQVLNESQVRFELDDIKVHVSSKNDGHISYQFDEDAKLLKLPWIVEYYKDSCLIESIYLASEPVWVSNIKRALSLNFQLKKGEGVYTVYEPCIHDYRCLITYMANGTSLKKYNSSPSSPKYGNSWISVPWTDPIYRQDQIVWNSLPDTTTVTTQREYKLNDNDDGISSIQLEEHISYKIGDQNLQIFTEININYETELQGVNADWPKLTRASVKYDRESCVDSLCGIKTHSQGYLKNKTFEILLKISKKGIDADNIVRNPAMIHSLDFIHLLNTMSQLNYTTLRFLFDDLVLSTSYELETSRNIFLEVLPYAGSIASVKFVKHLVIEEKEKIEDSALLALIRKLPFTGANYTEELLQELEAFTKLGLDFPQEIRHAAILSFATLLHQTKREGKVGDDHFDNMVVKYVRMYSDCPHYMDRLIWLQGLCNIGFWAQKYTMEIFTDTSKKRNERLWAAFSTNYVDNQYYTDGQVRMIDLLLPTLANQTEDVQIKMAALHVFLTSTTITQNDFLLVSRYIEGNPRLERFWCMAVNSMKTYRNFDGYKLAAMYVPSHDCPFAPSLWTTNNLIITTEDQASSVHFMSTADDMDLPNFAGLRITVGGKRVSVYIVAEGVPLNIYKRMHRFNEADLKVEKLVELLQEFRAYAVKPGEEVHVDLVLKVQEKAVFIGHMNQTRFDSWNLLELAKCVNDFLRLGSHINQQLVYYPSHNELIFPNELGIPVKLQTTKLSFTSIRGNLTTPSTDLHIRYQGVTLTSLSTFGALVQSEHSARVQSSTVAHLPIRFNATAAAGGVVNFISPNLQRGGIVMHTRTQVEKNANGSTDSYYISRNPVGEVYEVNESSIYFDCDHSAAGLELEDLFTTSFYDFLNSLRPSRLFLNSIPVLISSPSKACGVIYPPKTLGEDNGLLATLTMDDAPSVAGFMSGKEKELSVALVFKYYRQYAESPEDDTIFKFDADFSISHVDEKVITRLVVNGSRPNTSVSDWKLFLENEDYYVNSKNSYFLGLEYLGNLDIVYTAKDVSRILKVGYKTPEDRGGIRGKRIDYHVMNKNLPQELLTHLGLGCESETYRRIPLFSTSAEKAEFNASLKVEDTTASVSVNNDSETKFVSLGFNWLFETFTNLKTMANYGLYRACGFNKSSPENMTLLTAPYDFYYRPRSGPVECSERVLLADCTAVPRFAVIHQIDGGLKIYAGGYYIDAKRVGGRISVNETQSGGHLRVFPFQDGVKITSKLSAVEVIYKQESISILVPNSHLHAVCGECVGEEYKKCPETK